MNQNDGFRLTTITDRIGDEESAPKLYESVRWPDGPVCPHCGEINNAGQLQARPGSKKPVRKGVWKCYGCREQFSVTVGTIFEDSHIPLGVESKQYRLQQRLFKR